NPSMIAVSSELGNNAPRNRGPASGQLQSRKSNHCVASPIAEPVVAGNDGLLPPTRNDVLFCRRDKRVHQSVCVWRTWDNRFAPIYLGIAKRIRVANVVPFGGGNDSGTGISIEI